MKKVKRVLITFLTMLGIITPISTEASQYVAVDDSTPIILKHDLEIQQEKANNINEADETALYHYSHSSHQSHYSHSSHRSHYSHYSSR